MSILSQKLVMNYLKLMKQGNLTLFHIKILLKMLIYRKKFPSDKIIDPYFKNKFKHFETLLKSMKSEYFEERPDCCDVLAKRDDCLMSLDTIRETKEYKEFFKLLHNNSISDELLVKYAKYHFQL